MVHSFRLGTISKAIIIVLLLLALIALSSCGSSSTNSTTPTATSSSSTPTPTSTQPADTTGDSASAVSPATTPASQIGYAIKVYFSKSPDSLNNPDAVFPVNRFSPTIAVATFSIQLLIAGPTLSERNAGYFSELNSVLSGPSSCSSPPGGPDFTLTLDKKGSTPAPGTATLKLCRLATTAGIGADARISADIDATLKQFSNIKNVVILTQDGHCFGDETGLDHCLQ